MKNLKPIFAILFLFAAVFNVLAKGGTLEIYALVSKVVLEPNEKSPQRIQVWGTFSFNGKKPQQGYLYFKLPVTAPPAAQKECPVPRKFMSSAEASAMQAGAAQMEWVSLKTFAGTGRPVVFGGMGSQESLRVLRESAAAAKPVTYPVRGVSELTAQGIHRDEKNSIILALKEFESRRR